MITGVRHTGIVVQDIQGALDFWIRILGAKVITDQIEEGDFIEQLLGLEGVSVRTIKLDLGNKTVIELLKFYSHSSIKIWEGQPFSTGITHIALNVSNLNETTEILEKAGYSQINIFKVNPQNTVLVCYIRGFENILLELVQTL